MYLCACTYIQVGFCFGVNMCVSVPVCMYICMVTYVCVMWWCCGGGMWQRYVEVDTPIS